MDAAAPIRRRDRLGDRRPPEAFALVTRVDHDVVNPVVAGRVRIA